MITEQFFNYIPLKANKERILRRLGYNKRVDEISDENIKVINKGIREAESLIESKGLYRIFDIEIKDEERIVINNNDNNIVIKSLKLCNMLKNSNQVAVLASTAGASVVNRIKKEIEDGSATLALIIDAAASEMADDNLDYIMQYINSLIKREGMKTTKHRFSPGYGDLDISVQKKLFEILQLDKKLNLILTEKYMLIPEKSVIALCGIERII